MIRHLLLDNCNTCTHDTLTESKEEEETILYFRPDILDEFHPRLCHGVVEYAWLLEESLYLYREIDFAYVYRYASPLLKFELRREGRNCWIDPNVLSRTYRIEFEQKRHEIRRRLQLGYRRGPIMSRLIASLRWEGQRRKNDPTLHIQSSPTVSSSSSSSSTQMSPDKVDDTVSISHFNKETSTIKKLSTMTKSPVKVLTKKRRVSMTSKESLQSQKVSTLPNKLNTPRLSTTEIDSQSPTTIDSVPTTSSLPQSKILTLLESEVAWLIEESLLANPLDGPHFSFLQDNASFTLHSYLCSSSISDRRWLPRLYRSHDVNVSREFANYRLLIRRSLQDGYRRMETKHLLPSEYTPPPLLTRVQQVYHQAFVRTVTSKRHTYSSRTRKGQS